MPKKKAAPKTREIGHWSIASGDLEFEARIFEEECCEIAVFDVEGAVEIILAVGKAELDQVIKILESARCQVDLLPAHLQKGADEGDEGDEEEEEEDEGEEEEEALDA